MSANANVSMEDILGQLARDIITPKFANIKHTANTAIDILKDEDKLKKIEAWELREICLHPLLLALETRARRLGHTALVGIQVMFKDDRFQSSMETSDEDKWLPSQVLSVLTVAHSLPEDLQIEVMKLLLNMTVTASWCTSAKTIIKIAQMGYMSTRNISQFLAALEDVFKLAQDFDARPGLKFLLQKVASLDVAANLYKQMATAVLFYVHALVEVCAHLDDSNITSTRAAISQAEGTPETHGATSCVADLKQLAHTSLAKPWTSGNIFLPLLQNICEELCESYV